MISVDDSRAFAHSSPSQRIFAEILKTESFLVKDAVPRKEAKTSDKWDVYSAQTAELILSSREEESDVLTKACRFIGGDHDAIARFSYVVRAPGIDHPILRIKRGSSSLLPNGAKVEFIDEAQQQIASMKRLFTFRKKYKFSKSGAELFTLSLKNRRPLAELSINGDLVCTLHHTWDGPNAH